MKVNVAVSPAVVVFARSTVPSGSVRSAVSISMGSPTACPSTYSWMRPRGAAQVGFVGSPLGSRSARRTSQVRESFFSALFSWLPGCPFSQMALVMATCDPMGMISHFPWARWPQ